MLKYGGRLALIHRTERLCDLLGIMRNEGIEPKVLKMVHPRPGTVSKMFLVRGRKGSRPGLRVDPPLYVHDTEGAYSTELLELYAGGPPCG
ncbi:MAG TPA: hypothetical protein DD727_08230 [Clostridiales bacterium]|nr:hypothetical protein [Clostridiales bacterium]